MTFKYWNLIFVIHYMQLSMKNYPPDGWTVDKEMDKFQLLMLSQIIQPFSTLANEHSGQFMSELIKSSTKLL